MNAKLKYILTILAICISGLSMGQTSPEKAARMEENKFILRINLNWDELQKAKLAELFDLDTLLIRAIFDRNITFINDSTPWTAQTLRGNSLELYKDLGGEFEPGLDKTFFFGLQESARPPLPIILDAAFGVNEFTSGQAFKYEDGIACFALPGHSNAKNVYLSGSFNQWSTMQLPMQLSDSGWVACVELPPGKYLYKFIVDGRWMHDPNNRQRERDGNRGYNSVAFCYNHTFELLGFTNARRVVLAGSFNNWSTRELRMEKTRNGWKLPMYVREGTHSYKFIVDGTWITDPSNPNMRPDGRGNQNSFMAIGDTLIFRLKGFPQARRVVLAGNFNAWNPGELVMEKNGDEWHLPYVLAPGNYEYKYIVDGQWITDPNNPFTTGFGDFTNSFFAYKPTHRFTLDGFSDAQNVIITGSFNHWNTNLYRMAKQAGQWVFPIYLAPGRYSYKFIVDGTWITDPENPLWETNEFGGENSVLWIEFLSSFH